MKLWKTPLRFDFKIIPQVTSVSMKLISKDKISTGLGDRLYSSENVLVLIYKKSRIKSLNIKLINGPHGEIAILNLDVEKFGLIVKR